jgi:hypothetical protein
MMNGSGKSDSVIVAKKPANNAEPSAAEPRAEIKGNVGQQSTRRAQNRESVSQALDRIRQVARQRKKERFTALHHHIDADLFRMAFFALKRDAAAGVDRLMWKDYEADLERNLAIITCLPIAALIAFIAYEHLFAQASYPASDTNLKGGLRRRLRGFNQGDRRSTANDVVANHLTAALSPRYPAIVTVSASH